MSQSALPQQWHLNLRCLQNWSICLPIRRSSSVFVYTLWCVNIVILVIALLEVEIYNFHTTSVIFVEIYLPDCQFERSSPFHPALTSYEVSMQYSRNWSNTCCPPWICPLYCQSTLRFVMHTLNNSLDQRHLSTPHPTANKPHSVRYRHGSLLYEA
jgi:hypothetical protein